LATLSDNLLERSIRVVEDQVPELAETFMKVPLSYYRDPDIAARERDLFMTQPRPLAGSSQIPEPHSYIVRTSLGRSVLITRDAEGKAHAFLNYCRHRGAEPARGCGTARRFSCPYHGWTYDSRGRLVSRPLANRNPALDHESHGLVELPCEERHGLVWVILTPGLPIDVAGRLGALDQQIGEQHLETYDYVQALTLEPIDANWKCVGEGLVEGLHVPFVHGATFNVDPKNNDERTEERYSGFPDIGVYDRVGPHLHWAIPLFGGQGVGALRSELQAGASLDWRRLGHVWLITPGILIANDTYGFIIGVVEPGAAIDRAFVHYGWMAPPSPPANYPPPEAMAQRTAAAIMEDKLVWEGCGRGLALGGHDHVLIGRNEKGVQLLHEALAEQIGYDGLEYD
jgi:phenylpropionate dioxygenase-like ring-hydroxylating dioxygenase large terminal subunit